MKENVKKVIVVSIIALAVIIVTLFCGLFKVIILNKSKGEICYISEGVEIREELTEEEARKAAKILGGGSLRYNFGYPGCWYEKDVYITIGNQKFYPACDSCKNFKYGYYSKFFVYVEREDMEYIHSLFEEKGVNHGPWSY